MSPSAGHRRLPRRTLRSRSPGHKRNELRDDDQATHQFTMGSRDRGVNPPMSRGHFFAGNVAAVRATLAPASSDRAGKPRAAPARV
jgi:hypothetical protein